MTQANSNFRNIGGKCLYNDTGFCKFRSECKKQHFQNVCQIENCDKKCLDRHPKPCKFKTKCKFMAENICAFNHESDIDCDSPNNEVLERMALIEKHVTKNEIKLEKDFHELFQKIVDEQHTQSKNIEEKIKKEYEAKLKEEIEKVKIVIEKEKKELKSFYEKKHKELEKNFREEIKELKNSFDQASKAVECKSMKVNEKIKNETKIIFDKLEKLEKAAKECLKSGDKVSEIKESTNVETSKPKPKKVTKEDKENEIIAEFEMDNSEIFEARKNCGLDLTELKCKKCGFETHSEGMLRKHKRTVHQIKESNQNIILGFKNDAFHHVKLLEALGELNKIVCRSCDYKTNSKGELKIHEHENHA